MDDTLVGPETEAVEVEPVPEAPVRRGRSPRHLAFESLLIVGSVLLAFALNEWRSDRAERQLARNVIDGLYAEIGSNLELLERMQPVHAQFAQAIAELSPEALAGRPAFAVMVDRRSDGGSLIVPPARAAWETAVSTGALRLLDYETIAVLSRVYASQDDAVGQTTERLADIIFSTQMFDPAVGREAAQVVLALMRELSAQEEHLILEYRVALERLEDVGAG